MRGVLFCRPREPDYPVRLGVMVTLAMDGSAAPVIGQLHRAVRGLCYNKLDP